MYICKAINFSLLSIYKCTIRNYRATRENMALFFCVCTISRLSIYIFVTFSIFSEFFLLLFLGKKGLCICMGDRPDCLSRPDRSLTIVETPNPSIDELYVAQNLGRRLLRLRNRKKGSVGIRLAREISLPVHWIDRGLDDEEERKKDQDLGEEVLFLRSFVCFPGETWQELECCHFQVEIIKLLVLLVCT